MGPALFAQLGASGKPRPSQARGFSFSRWPRPLQLDGGGSKDPARTKNFARRQLPFTLSRQSSGCIPDGQRPVVPKPLRSPTNAFGRSGQKAFALRTVSLANVLWCRVRCLPVVAAFAIDATNRVEPSKPKIVVRITVVRTELRIVVSINRDNRGWSDAAKGNHATLIEALVLVS